jgi:transposase
LLRCGIAADRPSSLSRRGRGRGRGPGRKKRAKVAPAQVTGRGFVRALQGLLGRLREAYPHPNRVLFYDDVVVTYLLAFFNPVLRSLRCIEDASRLPGVNRFLSVGAVCRSTLGDANALFDPDLLLPLVEDLRARLPNLNQQDPALRHLLDRVTVADGSFFRLAADVAWAVHSSNQYKPGPGMGTCRLNCQFCLRGGVPSGVSVNGSDGVGEGAAAAAFVDPAQPGQVYLFDGGVVSFPYLAAILAAGSHFLCNLSAAVKFTALEDRPLAAADREAGVVSDRVGRLAGSDTRTPPAARLREVLVVYTARDGTQKTLRLLTDLLDLPAWAVAELYRHRWQVELFFRWLKVHANFRHLTSHSRNGVTLSFYVAVIAAMLMCLRTQKALSKYGYNLLSMVAAGLGDVDDVLPVLERRERERRLERERLARKKAAAKKRP